MKNSILSDGSFIKVCIYNIRKKWKHYAEMAKVMVQFFFLFSILILLVLSKTN